MSELAKQMRAHGIKSSWNLTEFDQWVNDATRRDIENLLAENKQVFGLKMWIWETIEAENLKGICNFGVDLIFRNEDRQKVKDLIEGYKHQKWSMLNAKKLVDKLFDLAIMSCTWV